MEMALTKDAVRIINEGTEASDTFQPLLQVIDLRRFGGSGTGGPGVERYRLHLSDGEFQQQAMLATQMNDKVSTEQIKVGTIVRLHEFICNNVQGRRVIIILNVEPIGFFASTIGNPQLWAAQGSGAASANAQAPGHVAPGEGKENHGPGPGGVGPKPGMPTGGPGHMTNGAGSGQGFGGQPAYGQPPQGGEAYQYNGGYGNGHGAAGPPAGKHDGYYGGGQHHQQPLPYQQQQPQQQPYQAPANPYQQGMPPAPMYGGSREPIARNEAPPRILPVRELNPYQNRWTIQVRVSARGDIKDYSTARTSGQVASVDLIDAESFDIRATMFSEAIKKFYHMLEVGRVFQISRGSLRPAKREFSTCKADYEITLDPNSTIITAMQGDFPEIPHFSLSLRPIAEVENCHPGTLLDVAGVVISVNPSTTIQRKDGRETEKQTLTLMDDSGRSVEVTLWGEKCLREGQQLLEATGRGQRPVVVLKGGRVSDFNGKSLGTINSAQLLIDPDLPTAQKLRRWFDANGAAALQQTVNISQAGSAGGGGMGGSLAGGREVRKLLSQIKDEQMGHGVKPDVITVRASVTNTRLDNRMTSLCYPACPLRNGDKACSKKLVSQGTDWYCERCGQSVQQPEWRYVAQVCLIDSSGTSWATAFNEAGAEIYGYDANTLQQMQQSEDDGQLGDGQGGRVFSVVEAAQYKLQLFKIKVKSETYNDEQRIKCTILKAEPVNFVSETERMLDDIRKMSLGEPVFTTPAGGGGVGYAAPPAGGTAYGSYGGGNPYSTTAGGSSYGGSAAGGGSYGGSYGGGYGGGGGSGAGGGSGGNCFKCGESGHWSRDCPATGGSGSVNGGYGGGSGFGGGGGYGGGSGVGGGSKGGGSCFKCGESGHWARDCPASGGGGGGYGGGGGSYGGGGGGYGGGGGGYGGGGGGYGGGGHRGGGGGGGYGGGGGGGGYM